MHFYIWGLPRSVEGFLWQFISLCPTYFPNLKEKTAISFIIMLYLRPLLKRWGFISLTWDSWEVSQFTQTFWGFEGSTMDPEQISMCVNPKLHGSGSTLYHLLVTKVASVHCLGDTPRPQCVICSMNTAIFLWLLFSAQWFAPGYCSTKGVPPAPFSSMISL